MNNMVVFVTAFCCAVTVGFTLVAVLVDVNARAQRLAEHAEVTTQRGASDPLQTHTELNVLELT